MTLAEKLSKKPVPPPYAAKLRKFQTCAVADHLGISPSYCALILQGARPPSKRLEARIMQLVADIEAEQR